MYCKHSGFKNENGAKFCGSCGKKLEDINMASVIINNADSLDLGTHETVQVSNNSSQMPNQKMEKKVLAAFLIAILGIGIYESIHIYQENKTTDISLLDTSFEELITIYGTDGSGSYSINKSEFSEQLDEKITTALNLDDDLLNTISNMQINDSKLKKLGYAFQAYSSVNLDAEVIDSEGNLKENGTLSNGDKIIFSANIPSDILREAKLTTSNTTYTMTVSGLPEITTVDIFAGASLEWVWQESDDGNDYVLQLASTEYEDSNVKVTYSIDYICSNDNQADIYADVEEIGDYCEIDMTDVTKDWWYGNYRKTITYDEKPTDKIDEDYIRGYITANVDIKVRSNHSEYSSQVDKEVVETGSTVPVYAKYYSSGDYVWYRIGEDRWIALKGGDNSDWGTFTYK